MGKKELIDIAGELRGETDKAYRIYDGKTTAALAAATERWHERGFGLGS